MRFVRISLIAVIAVWSMSVLAQTNDNTAAENSNSTTVRGCMQGDRGNYIVVEDKTGSIFVLKGVGNKLDNYLHHEVEVKGKVLSGTVKTGVRPEKSGSNPSDVVHGVDGAPFQVANPKSDIHLVSKKCKAADQD